jgi:hypothetical protein
VKAAVRDAKAASTTNTSRRTLGTQGQATDNLRCPKLEGQKALASATCSPDKMQPILTIKSAPIDLELCELLGDKPGDFLVLCFDGVGAFLNQ